jgi:hypothetical protein
VAGDISRGAVAPAGCRAAAGATAVCLAVLLGYAAAQDGATGDFGLTRFGGWPLYARVASFADCRKFTPPAGSAGLCESTPSARRAGPDHYLWDSDSPAQRLFGAAHKDGSRVTAFALAAIEHQPFSYLYVVARDTARYVDPGLFTGPGWGTRPLVLDQRWPWEERTIAAANRSYGAVHIRVRHSIMSPLETWREVVRIHGGLLAVALMLALAGLVLGGDRQTRRTMALLVGFAAVLLIVPVATLEYTPRYAIPGAILLLIAGARGAELCALRVARARAPARQLAS